MAQVFQNKKTKLYGFRIFYYDEHKKKHSIQKTNFKRKVDAINAAARLEIRKGNSNLQKAEHITFEGFFKEWMNTYKIDRYSESTDNKYKNAHLFIKTFFGNKLLKDITRMDYQRMIDTYSLTHVKDSIYRLNGYINSCLNDAIDQKLINSNFTRNVVITSKKKGKSKELKYLQYDETQNLKAMALANASIFNVSAYEILFALGTGARYAEIVGMTWDCVDLDKNIIEINKTYDYKKRTGFLPTKTESSVRSITISPELATQLHKLKIEQKALFLKQGFKNKLNLVFMNYQHYVPSDTAANKKLRSYLLSDKIKAKNLIGFHGLRHTHASILIGQGLTLEYVSQRLGHSNVGITSRVYVHLLNNYREKEDAKAIKALNDL